MKFCEAMDLLKAGKRMTRTVWKGSMYFLHSDDGVTSYEPRFRDYTYDEDIMVSTGWRIDGDEKEYNFCEIIPFLNNGAKARMTDWKDAYIFFDKPTGKLVLYMMEGFPFMPGFDAFMATDWIEDDPI